MSIFLLILILVGTAMIIVAVGANGGNKKMLYKLEQKIFTKL